MKNPTFPITESEAKAIYPVASQTLRSALMDTYGADALGLDITERIKSMDDVYKFLGAGTPNESEWALSGLSVDEIAYRHMKALTLVLNEGWKPDWYNESEQKWFPYFRVSSSGFAFCDADYGNVYPYAGHASRICFKTKELAEYAGKLFTSIYESFILIK
jgi:hypothetical protein